MAMGAGPTLEEGDSYRPLAEINVTPLVDVMLVLLIIFMVAAPLMMVGVPVTLPKTSAAKVSETKAPVIVSVRQDGAVFVGEEEVPRDKLVGRLAAQREIAPDAVVYVRGDRRLDYGRVMEVMGLVGQSGYSRMSLIAEGASAK